VNGRPARVDQNSNSERDTSLISHRIALDIHRERQREIERRLELRRAFASRPSRGPSFRRFIGQALIQLGSAIDPDCPEVIAASR
jgi:hypothetical protein